MFNKTFTSTLKDPEFVKVPYHSCIIEQVKHVVLDVEKTKFSTNSDFINVMIFHQQA